MPKHPMGELQLRILGHLRRNGPCRLGDICQALDRDRRTMGITLKRMTDEHGWVKHHNDLWALSASGLERCVELREVLAP